MDSLGGYRDRMAVLRTIVTNPVFEPVREGILRRFFFYAKYRHQVLVDFLEEIYQKDPVLFQNIFIYVIPPFRSGPFLRAHPKAEKAFLSQNDFLLGRFSVGNVEIINDAAKNLPSLSLVDLINQMNRSTFYGSSPRSVAKECLEILALRKDITQVRDLLDPELQRELIHLIKDQAMLNTQNGGIDMNPAQMSMQIKKEGQDFHFNFNGQNIDAAQAVTAQWAITGATFTIHQMTPVTDLPMLLGLPT